MSWRWRTNCARDVFLLLVETESLGEVLSTMSWQIQDVAADVRTLFAAPEKIIFVVTHLTTSRSVWYASALNEAVSPRYNPVRLWVGSFDNQDEHFMPSLSTTEPLDVPVYGSMVKMSQRWRMDPSYFAPSQLIRSATVHPTRCRVSEETPVPHSTPRPTARFVNDSTQFTFRWGLGCISLLG
ncbi:hypothetical protein B0H16DRAFT_418419 [Mycena metata]|uniref:Uncharacterized protein n=1 Tax=Mycena metata TaxID=1033252 RepID=A0AAD7HEL9_9AGAR|nr:hypothetical protein B0H16DRAFT_418419 [Mycena metata]